jgi:hypothetical protein
MNKARPYNANIAQVKTQPCLKALFLFTNWISETFRSLPGFVHKFPSQLRAKGKSQIRKRKKTSAKGNIYSALEFGVE